MPFFWSRTLHVQHPIHWSGNMFSTILKGLTNQSGDAVQFWIIWTLSLPRILFAGLQMEHVFLKGKLKAKIRSFCLTVNNSEKKQTLCSLCIYPQIPIKHDMDLTWHGVKTTGLGMWQKKKKRLVKSSDAKWTNLKIGSLNIMCGYKVSLAKLLCSLQHLSNPAPWAWRNGLLTPAHPSIPRAWYRNTDWQVFGCAI